MVAFSSGPGAARTGHHAATGWWLLRALASAASRAARSHQRPGRCPVCSSNTGRRSPAFRPSRSTRSWPPHPRSTPRSVAAIHASCPRTPAAGVGMQATTLADWARGGVRRPRERRPRDPCCRPRRSLPYRLSDSEMTHEHARLAVWTLPVGLPSGSRHIHRWRTNPMPSSDMPNAPGHRAVPGGPFAIGPRRSRYKP